MANYGFKLTVKYSIYYRIFRLIATLFGNVKNTKIIAFLKLVFVNKKVADLYKDDGEVIKSYYFRDYWD